MKLITYLGFDNDNISFGRIETINFAPNNKFEITYFGLNATIMTCQHAATIKPQLEMETLI